jgi:hypothetical protein
MGVEGSFFYKLFSFLEFYLPGGPVRRGLEDVIVSRRGERRGMAGQLVTTVHLVPGKSPGWVVHLHRKSANQQERKVVVPSGQIGSV